MQQLLLQSSELACQALLRGPAATESTDPVAIWRERFQVAVRPKEPHLLKAVALAVLHDCMADLFPIGQLESPGWLKYEDALSARGSGALYNGKTGQVLPGSFLSRGPRQQQVPHCQTFRLELAKPLSHHPRLQEAVYLPFALCSNFGHFVTETLAFLWPLFASDRSRLAGLPVLLPGAPAAGSCYRLLHQLLAETQAVAVYGDHLPEQLGLTRVWVPEPSLRLHAAFSALQMRTARAIGDRILALDPNVHSPVAVGGRLYISRSALPGSVRAVDQEVALEERLVRQGWTVFHPQAHPLSVQVAAYRSASVIAGFEGSAIHGLSWLGVSERAVQVILLGDALASPDYLLQLRSQGLAGFFIECVKADPSSEGQALHQRRLILQCSVQVLADLLETLAAASSR